MVDIKMMLLSTLFILKRYVIKNEAYIDKENQN